MNIREDIKKYNSTIFLILANFIPIIGVIFFNFNIAQILILYWFETLIIGFFTILKIFYLPNEKSISKFISSFSFLFRFGLSILFYLIFIIAMISVTGYYSGPINIFEIFKITFSIFFNGSYLENLLSIISLLSLFISHAFSFYLNFIRLEEDKLSNLRMLENLPFSRIFQLHLSIVFGGFILIMLKILKAGSISLIGVLLLLILFKTYEDLNAHINERIKINSLKK